MIKDTVVILAVILVLMIIIAVFGGCVRCSNNYTREMYTTGAPVPAPSQPSYDGRRPINKDAAPTAAAAPTPVTPAPSGGQPFLDVTGTMLGHTSFVDSAATFS